MKFKFQLNLGTPVEKESFARVEATATWIQESVLVQEERKKSMGNAKQSHWRIRETCALTWQLVVPEDRTVSVDVVNARLVCTPLIRNVFCSRLVILFIIDYETQIELSASPGESCTESVTCSGLSVCKDNRCTCINEMIVRDKLCVQRRKVNIGNSCEPEDQCLGNSTCYDNFCQCPTGHVASLNVCVLRKTGICFLFKSWWYPFV